MGFFLVGFLRFFLVFFFLEGSVFVVDGFGFVWGFVL